ncbi:MAG: cobalamin B12-binding domain-containing protein [Glaciimonas sp.]|nr:cobalamin B12-binding domain-containing protein [Glaciimonas sp.]
MSIGAVERDTGLSKDALRVWERRYGFPMPSRDDLGERAYPVEQVNKLRLLKRLLDQGHRPGKIIHHSIQALQQLLQQSVTAAAADAISATCAGGGDLAVLQDYLDLCQTHQAEVLRHRLSQALSRMGLERFIIEILGPLNCLVGDAWASGILQIFEEHLYTESVQVVMRNAISTLPLLQGEELARPRILLTTLPQEQHGLGLLMAEAIFVLDGASCISLGVQTPVADIVSAVHSQGADIVALSFSGVMNPRQVLEGLTDLSSKLPAGIELWVGGHCAVLARRPPKSVYVLNSLIEIHTSLKEWRARQAV